MQRGDTLRTLFGGALAGLAGGFFGIGGGAVLTPILTSRRFGLTQHQAHGTSLAVVGGTAILSIIVYALNRNVSWLMALAIAPTSLLTARYGARLAARTPAGLLTRVFAVFLLLIAARLLWKAPAPTEALVHGTGALVLFAAVLGLAVGVLSGYMGVGGGVLIVPGLTIALGWPQHLAQGTSLAVILAVAPAGAIEHARHGNVVRRIVPPLAIGAALGSPIAAWLAQRMDRQVLTRAFAAFLVLTAIMSWRRAGSSPKRAGEVHDSGLPSRANRVNPPEASPPTAIRK